MNVVLWDTHRSNVPRLNGNVARVHWSEAIRRSVPRAREWKRRIPFDCDYAFLASAFRNVDQQVRYCVDIAPSAGQFVFVPRVETLPVELDMIQTLLQARTGIEVLVFGSVGRRYRQLFAEIGVDVQDADPRQIGVSAAAERNGSARIDKSATRGESNWIADWQILGAGRETGCRTEESTCEISIRPDQSVSELFAIIRSAYADGGFRYFCLVDRILDQDPEWFEEFNCQWSYLQLPISWSAEFSSRIAEASLGALVTSGLRHVRFVGTPADGHPPVGFCQRHRLQNEIMLPISLSDIPDQIHNLLNTAANWNADRTIVEVDSLRACQLIRSTSSRLPVSIRFPLDSGFGVESVCQSVIRWAEPYLSETAASSRARLHSAA